MTASPGRSDYRYGPTWKANVDHAGEEWRAYCEALACVKRFLRTERLEGRVAATRQWQTHLQDRNQRGGPDSASRLLEAFRLIGIHEGPTLRAQLPPPEMQDTPSACPNTAAAYEAYLGAGA